MTKGKAFEILVKRILINIGFTEVNSDGLYVFDGTAGQMIQGLGEAHNADVLLQPPVQIPFYTPSRIIIECKDYTKKVGLNTLRSALGLREDINNFEVVDFDVMRRRRANNRRNRPIHSYDRYYYQVAVASMSGFTPQAQEFALTHRISLINFNEMPFWKNYIGRFGFSRTYERNHNVISFEETIELADAIGKEMAVAITSTGQMLFLYSCTGTISFDELYTLHWADRNSLWQLSTGNSNYLFQLPEKIREAWLDNLNGNDLRENAINCKAKFLSNMVVYYFEDYKPTIKMISIDRWALEEAKKNLYRR